MSCRDAFSRGPALPSSSAFRSKLFLTTSLSLPILVGPMIQCGEDDVKSRSVKIVLSDFEIISLLCAFTSGQRLVRVIPERKRSGPFRRTEGRTEAMMRNQQVLRANDYRPQTTRISSIEPTSMGTALSRDRAPALLGRFYLADPAAIDHGAR